MLLAHGILYDRFKESPFNSSFPLSHYQELMRCSLAHLSQTFDQTPLITSDIKDGSIPLVILHLKHLSRTVFANPPRQATQPPPVNSCLVSPHALIHSRLST